MKKNVFISIFVLSCFSYAVYAQDANERLSRFTYEVGIGTSVLIGIQNFSPWGVHYRGNFNRGTSIYAQVNYIFPSQILLGFKFESFGTAGNYTLASGQRVAENIGILYFAPQWGDIRSFSPRISTTYHIGIGYVRYQSDGLLDNAEYRIRSHMVGANVDFLLGYSLARNNVIGFRTSIFTAFSNGRQHREIGGETSMVTMNEMNRIIPARIDFSLFWRVQF